MCSQFPRRQQSATSRFPALPLILFLLLTGLRGASAAETRSDAPSAPAISSTLYAGHVASDATWWTRLAVVNPGAAATTLNLTLFDGAGTPLQNRGVSYLAPGGRFAIDVDDIFSADVLGSDRWVLIESGVPLQGALFFGTRDGQSFVQMPLGAAVATDLVFPYVAMTGPETSSWYTGITLLNTSPESAAVNLTAYSEDGLLLGNVSVIIPGRSKYVRLVNQSFPLLDAMVIRSVRVSSDRPLLGFELFGSLQTGWNGLAGLPAAFPPAGGTSSLVYNEIPSNSSYYTGATFSNLGPVPADVQVDLYDAAGSLLRSRTWSSVSPAQQITRELWDLSGGTAIAAAAYLQVRSVAPLLGFELLLSRNTPFRFDGVTAAAAGYRFLCFPEARIGPDDPSMLHLTNLSTAVNPFTINAYDDNGMLRGTYTGSLAPGARLSALLMDLFPSAGPFTWLSVSASNLLTGTILMVSADLTRMGCQPGMPYDGCAAPTVVAGPASQTGICAGATATFSVTATGSAPLHYAWYQGGAGNTTTPAPGATDAPTYTTPSLTATTSYWVRVSNACDFADSLNATATVGQPVAITAHPADATISSGANATLTVSASGTSPSYQWYQGLTGITDTPVGANAPSFTTPALTASTNYWVRVSNACNSVNSNASMVTVSPACVPPAITEIPAGASICSGGSITLTVAATGTAPLTYAWLLPDGSPAPGATNSPTYTTPHLTSTAYYWVRVSNSCDIAESDTFAVDVLEPAVITTQPSDQTVCQYQRATLQVAASGSGPLYYQWYQGLAGDTSLGEAPGASHAAVYTTPALSADARYWVRVVNSCGQENSRTVSLSVTDPPSILDHPANAEVSSGGRATLSVRAAGPGLTYQWFRGGTGDTTAPVSGATGSSWTTPALSSITSYWVRVSNGCGDAYSNTVTVTVAASCLSPAVTGHLQDQQVEAGQTAMLFVVATGTDLHYDWYQGNVGDFSISVGQDAGPSITTPPLTSSLNYWVQIWNGCGATYSYCSVGVLPCAPVITLQPADAYCRVEGVVTLRVAAGAAGLIYQWYRGPAGDTSHPVGANEPTLNTGTLYADQRYWVRVARAANPACFTDSRVCLVTVKAPGNRVELLTYPAMDFRFVPNDPCLIGAPAFRPCRNSPAETERFLALFSHNLAVCATPVTQGNWSNLTALIPLPADPSQDDIGPDLPVNSVPWNMACLFANALSLLKGFDRCYYIDAAFTVPFDSSNWHLSRDIYCDFSRNGFRLPTEVEFEAFTKCGYFDDAYGFWGEGGLSDTNCAVQCFHSATLDSLAWYCHNNESGTVHPVTSKPPNLWGLYGTLSGVPEWCWDGFVETRTLTGAPMLDYKVNPGTNFYRCLRGNPSGVRPPRLRTTRRDNTDSAYPTHFFVYPGFRLVRNLP